MGHMRLTMPNAYMHPYLSIIEYSFCMGQYSQQNEYSIDLLTMRSVEAVEVHLDHVDSGNGHSLWLSEMVSLLEIIPQRPRSPMSKNGPLYNSIYKYSSILVISSIPGDSRGVQWRSPKWWAGAATAR